MEEQSTNAQGLEKEKAKTETDEIATDDTAIIETARTETAATEMYTTQSTNAYVPVESKKNVILQILRNLIKRKKVLIIGIVLILILIWVTSASSSYSKGLDAVKNKQWDTAIAAFSLVKESDKNYENAKHQIETLKKKKEGEEALIASAEMYKSGLAAMTNKDWDKAIQSLGLVLSVDPNYQNSLSKIIEVNINIASESLISGKNKFANNDLSGAKTDLENAIQHNPKLIEAESLLKTILTKIDDQQKQAEIQRQAEERQVAEKAAADQAEADRVAYDTGITYNQLARTPNDFYGTKVKFNGKVIQVMDGDKEVKLRIAVNNNYDNILLVTYEPKITAIRVLENDNVTVKGDFWKIDTYESTGSGNISIPLVVVHEITIN